MSTKDELEKLDEALAAGQLSADEHQRRRDSLMSQSSERQDQRPDPFPPAFQWESTSPTETTRSIAPIPSAEPGGTQGADDRSEQTQVVHSGVTEAAADSDTTQVVAAQFQAPPPPGGDLPSQGQGWSGYQQPFPPPRAGEQGLQEFPPTDGTVPPWTGHIAYPNTPGWGVSSYQGPENFEREPSAGKGRIFAIIGVVVLIAALVTGGVLFFSLNSTPTAEGPPSGPIPPTVGPTTSPPPEPFGPLVVPSGISPAQRIYTPTELDELKPLPTPDLIVLKQSGIAEARSVIVDDQGTTTSLWAFTAGGDPVAMQEALDLDQQRFRYLLAPTPGPADLEIYTSQQETADGRVIAVFRTHYVSGDNVIRVETYADDAVTARERFDQVLAAQLDHDPLR